MKTIKYISIFLFIPILFLLHSSAIAHEIYGNEDAFAWENNENKLPSHEKMNLALDLRDFFTALREGNINIIRNFLNENLQEEYRLSLNDPSYPRLLKEIYGDSKMIVERVEKNKFGAFDIEVQIISPKTGTNQLRFEIEQKEMEQKKEIGRGPHSHRLRSFTVRY